MKKQLEALGRVSDVILDLKLASLKQVSSQAAELVTEIKEIGLAQDARARQLSDHHDPDLAQLSGQDTAWADWVETQLQSRNVKLAQLYAVREDRVAEARHAMGRAEVIKKLIRKKSR